MNDRPSLQQVTQSVTEILLTDCADPAAVLIAHGEALVKVGTALQGLSRADAKSVLAAVSELVKCSTSESA